MTHTTALAKVSRRFFALIIDLFLLSIVIGVFLFFSMGKTPPREASGDEGRPSLMDKYQSFAYFEPIVFENGVVRKAAVKSLMRKFPIQMLIAFLLIPLAYNVFFEGRWGATIGKRICRIRVMKIDGTKSGSSTALVRFIGKLISSLVFMIGYLIALFDSEHRTLHDRVAKTMVVDV